MITKKYQRVEKLYNSDMSSALFWLSVKSEKLDKEVNKFFKTKYPKGL